MSQQPNLSRRHFLRVSAAAGGGLLISLQLPGAACAAAGATVAGTAEITTVADFAPNAFVRIAGDGRVTVILNKSEMGQGISTSLAMALAEELDADWQQRRLRVRARQHLDYAHPGLRHPDDRWQHEHDGDDRADATRRRHRARDARVGRGEATGACPRPQLRHRRAARLVTMRASGRSPATAHSPRARRSCRRRTTSPLKAPRALPAHRQVDCTAARHAGEGRRHGAVFGLDVYVPGMLTALVRASAGRSVARPRRSRIAAARAVPGVKRRDRRRLGDRGGRRGLLGGEAAAATRCVVDWDLGPHGGAGDSAALRAEYAAKLAANAGPRRAQRRGHGGRWPPRCRTSSRTTNVAVTSRMRRWSR
jgi:isoquinoline 1-oxidoreductase beta subunit